MCIYICIYIYIYICVYICIYIYRRAPSPGPYTARAWRQGTQGCGGSGAGALRRRRVASFRGRRSSRTPPPAPPVHVDAHVHRCLYHVCVYIDIHIYQYICVYSSCTLSVSSSMHSKRVIDTCLGTPSTREMHTSSSVMVHAYIYIHTYRYTHIYVYI